jgi:hypothetical protein
MVRGGGMMLTLVAEVSTVDKRLGFGRKTVSVDTLGLVLPDSSLNTVPAFFVLRED